MARAYTADALEVLASIMTDEKETGSARVAAVNAILDRAYGKPKQTVEGDEDNPIRVVTRVILEAASGNGQHQATA